MTHARALAIVIVLTLLPLAQTPAGQSRSSSPAADNAATILRPSRVFDGDAMHEGWGVLVRGERIEAVGVAASLDAQGATTVDLPGATLLPGLIDAHSHVLLHPYNETSWNDQVAHETLALRIARATMSLKATLDAGFTTIRDLGTEGAGYSDVGLKQAVQQDIIPGPRMLVATRAIVATGTYGPKGYPAEWFVPQGAEEADGDALVRVVRDQAGKGADWIKIYGDYRAGPRGENVPTFSQEEMNLIVATAKSIGRPVAVHASTAEGMRRAVLAGVETIEHGDGGTADVFKLMAERHVTLCPTVAAGDATAQYAGWKKGTDAGTGRHPPQARFVQARTRRGRDHRQRIGRRRLRARRQRARARDHGELRHAARSTRCARRHRSMPACCIWTIRSDGSRKDCSRISWRWTAIPPPTSPPCIASGW